ncbi:hypothetical protein AHAS_Ahas04G0114000 [Arachis hypogaea]
MNSDGEALRRAWHTRPWACHAGTNFQKHGDKEDDLGHATWCRRRGTPRVKQRMACHLNGEAWHAKSETEGRDTPEKRQSHASWKITFVEFLFPPNCNFLFTFVIFLYFLDLGVV